MTKNIVIETNHDFRNLNAMESKIKFWNCIAAVLVFGSLVINVAFLSSLFPQKFAPTSISTKINMTIPQLHPKSNTKNVTDRQQTTENGANGTNVRNETYPSKENMCTSDHCLQAVSDLKSYMNESCDPCEDFYTYACGNWIHEQENKLKKFNLTVTSIFQQIDVENKIIIRNLLEKLDLSVSPYEAEKKAKTFYDSCVHENLVDTDCTDETMNFFPEVTAKIFVEYEFLSQKDSLETLTQNIIKNFKTMLSNFFWIDNGTLQTFQNHVDKVLSFVGYVDTTLNTTKTDQIYENITLLEKDYYKNILRLGEIRDVYERVTTQTNAFYETIPHKINEQITYIEGLIFISAGLAKRPYFDRTYASVINFSKIGYMLGHELGHSFLSFFTKVMEPIPLKTVDIASTMKNFSQGLQCIENYFNNRTWTHTQSGLKIKINGSSTLEENIADIMGLQIAFKSFLEYGGIFVPLVGLEKFSKEQVFFIASAQVLCKAFVDEASAKLIFDYQTKNNAHSPKFVRVMGSFANSPDFSKTFNCPLGSAYNPKDRCPFLV